MSKSRILTRAYTDSSDAQLISRKGPRGSLSRTELLNEFRKHANISKQDPTALVSVSPRIVDTLKRCFDKFSEDNESPAGIWIAFIEIPGIPLHETRHIRVHYASELAEHCGLPDPNLYAYEMVFEWAVPEDYVVHKVSLQTLMDRGLRWDDQYGSDHKLPPTAELRERIANELPSNYPWEIGIILGSFARNFGARAPLDWITKQLFHDCVKSRCLDEDIVRLNFANGQSKIVDWDFFCALDDGIETALIDWWFLDFDFLQNIEEFEEWRDHMVWHMSDLWEDWEDVKYDDVHSQIAFEEMWNKKDKIDAMIEAEAVKLGL